MTVVLPPHGFVELIDSCADDLGVVNAARVSLAKESDWEDVRIETGSVIGKRLKDSDVGLVEYLMRNKHGTPFEQNFFKWRVRAPLFVFREWHRHRIGWSYNEESARYTQLQPDFYIPARDDVRSQQGKPGAYTFEREEDDAKAEGFQSHLDRYSKSAYYNGYQDALDEGVAKELARAFLPVNIFSQMICSCNARSLMNFITLRAAPTALKEIRVYAQAMEVEFKKIMPVTAAAFERNERVAP